jgi:hypothetical protein
MSTAKSGGTMGAKHVQEISHRKKYVVFSIFPLLKCGRDLLILTNCRISSRGSPKPGDDDASSTTPTAKICPSSTIFDRSISGSWVKVSYSSSCGGDGWYHVADENSDQSIRPVGLQAAEMGDDLAGIGAQFDSQEDPKNKGCLEFDIYVN